MANTTCVFFDIIEELFLIGAHRVLALQENVPLFEWRFAID